MTRIGVIAEYVWDDREQVRLWMHLPHPKLAGLTPFATASTEIGARSVEALLA